MDREQAEATLRACEPELKAIGVLSASLFGSVARGDAGPDSDVDAAVQLADKFSTGGYDYFWQLDQLQRRLSRVFGCKVDVVAEPARKQHFQKEIDRDRALVFQPRSAPPCRTANRSDSSQVARIGSGSESRLNRFGSESKGSFANSVQKASARGANRCTQ